MDTSTSASASTDLSQGTLPFTGLNILILALTGLVMLLLGTGLRRKVVMQPRTATAAPRLQAREAFGRRK